ncbi:MAG: hypothetical protein KC503_07195 [Myxococcales bacterium]|nr:hypothetical protein [Myxococcales bacterium]
MTLAIKTVLFGNPTAQSGRAAEFIERARVELDEAGIAHDFEPTRPRGETVDFVRAAIDSDRYAARRLIALGGDGTFSEVARGILASQHAGEVTMGMLPLGTANDQGRSFGLQAGEDGLERNVAVIAAGHLALLDAGKLSLIDRAGKVLLERLFFDSASVGFSAAILRTRNRDERNAAELGPLGKLYRGHLAYVGAALAELANTYVDDSAKLDIEAELDGKRYRWDRLLDVIIKNTRVYAGQWVLAPESQPDDGMLELVPITSRRELTSKLLSNLDGSLLDDEALRGIGVDHERPISFSQLSLHVSSGSEPPAVQADGEELGRARRLRVDVLARALRLIVPLRYATTS